MFKSIRLFPTLIVVALLALAGSGCTAKMKASYHLHRAEQFFAGGNYASAEIEYKNVLRHDPKNAGAWSRLGIIYFYEGRLDEDGAILSKAEKLSPNDLDVRLKLGTVYKGMGMLKQAQAEAEYVLDRKPQDDQAPLLLAGSAATTNDATAIRLRLQALRQKSDDAALEVAGGILAMRENDLRTAAASFNRALALDPKSSYACSALGALYLAQKDVKRADGALQKAAELAPVWTGNGVRYAQFKVINGDTAAGEKQLQDITAKAPYYLPAWLALAQIAAAGNDFTNALDLLGNVLSRDPQNFEGLSLQGRLLLAEGKTPQAITGFAQMTSLFPQAPIARYQLAQAYLVNHQTNEANNCLVQALSLNPKYADASLLLAEIQLAAGDTSPVIVSMRKLIQEQPQVVGAWLLLANAYRAQGMVDDSVRIYHELEKDYPKSPQIPVLLGTVFLQEQKNAEARRELEKALLLAPDYLPALERLVDLDLAEKQYTEALQRVQQMAVNDPKQASLQLLLGKTLAAEGENSQAESALAKAIALQPDSPAAYLMLAKLHLMAGQRDQASEVLEKALALDPNNLAALMLLAYNHESDKDYEKARDTYERMQAIAPDNAMVLNNLACLEADHLDQLEKAYPLAVQARNAAPADPSIADTLGWIDYRRKEYSVALGLLRESAGKLSQVPEIQFHLGMAAYRTGRETEARQAFQAALQLTNAFPEKVECQHRLAIINIIPGRAGADTLAWLEKWTVGHVDDTVAFARLAAIFELKGMTDQAIAANEAILKTNPQYVSALVNLARLYGPVDLQKADALAKSAYQLTPTDPEVTHILGRLSFQTGDYPWALSLLQLTAQAQPDNPEVQFDLGEAFYSFGKVPEARAAMQNALPSGGAFTRAAAARRFLAMTDGSNPPTSAQVDEILKSTPDYVPALMAKAAIAQQNLDLAAATKIYGQVLKYYPGFLPAEKLLGVLAYRDRDYVRAADWFQQCERQTSQDPELMYYLGMTQYGLKHGTESKSDLQAALTLNLSGEHATEARRILAELK